MHSIGNTGDTKVIIKAKNAAGFYSDEAYEHYYATVEPGPVIGFTAIQNGEYVELFWDKHAESDVVSYEITEGASFDMGQLVVSGVTTTEYSVKVDTERNYYYHIKAINRALKYSTAATPTGLYVANLPIKNVIQEYDEITLQTGAKTNVEFGPSLINWSNMGGRFTNYPTTKFSDVGGQTVLKLKQVNVAGADSNFETGANGFTAYWNSTATLTSSTDDSYNGTHCLKTVCVTPGTSGYGVVKPVNITPLLGKTITLSWYVKGVGSSIGKPVLANIYENVTGGGGGPSVVLSGNWQRISVTRTIPANATTIYIYWLGSLTAGDIVYADCVQLEVGSTSTAYGSYYPSGTYQTTTKDMGQVITANITADFRSTVVLRGLGSAVLQIRTSQDGTNWTAWQDFKPAQYTFRYLDARVLLATEDPTNTPEVNHLALRIDVPDTDKAGTIVIPVGGATVDYGHHYYSVPVLTPMAIGDNRFPVILSKTNTGFTVKITDRAGADVGGTLDWRVKGY